VQTASLWCVFALEQLRNTQLSKQLSFIAAVQRSPFFRDDVLC
jgi:hypothetical protein